MPYPDDSRSRAEAPCGPQRYLRTPQTDLGPLKQEEESPRPRQVSQITASMTGILPEDELEARTRRK